jgi:hypothetical protein
MLRFARRKAVRRVTAAKAALAAKLVGYEGGFPPSADGSGQQSAAELAKSVVSAEHIPVPKEKVQTAREAVVLLLNGQLVQSLQRGGLSFVPVQLVDGGAADSFEVLMEAPTLLYRTNAEAQAHKQQQIRDAAKRIADAKATLAELKQALARSEAACKATVKAASDHRGNAELSEIGAMVPEQQRISTEIAKQQATQTAQEKQLTDLKKFTDSQLQLTEHRITPRFSLQSGVHALRVPAGEPEQVLQVARQSQLSAQGSVQFSHSVAGAK